MQIVIEIDSCKKCPFFRSEKVYTADSFENISNWFCDSKRRKIYGHVDLNEKPPIPEWCPAKLK